MERIRNALILISIGLLCSQVEGDWLAGSMDGLTRNARHLINGGNEVMKSLEKEIRNKRTILEKTSSGKQAGEAEWFKVNLVGCANMTYELAAGETLLVAGAALFYDADNDFNDLISCYGKASSYDCWSQIIDKLPDFMENYKPITACYINNVFYSIEMIEYYFEICIGNQPEPPVPPPETFEKCVINMK